MPGEFPPEALAEAEAAAARAAGGGLTTDRREIELFTIDPPGSMDLDQAVALERRGTGYRVHYAIADVAAFVTPGGALDAEAHRRALTRYLPDGNAPLHPRVLSEGAASLLPGGDRPATLWTIDLDADGLRTAVDLRRALVRSRERFDYATVQQRLDAGSRGRAAAPPARGRRAPAGARARARRDQPPDPRAGGRARATARSCSPIADRSRSRTPTRRSRSSRAWPPPS